MNLSGFFGPADSTIIRSCVAALRDDLPQPILGPVAPDRSVTEGDRPVLFCQPLLRRALRHGRICAEGLADSDPELAGHGSECIACQEDSVVIGEQRRMAERMVRRGDDAEAMVAPSRTLRVTGTTDSLPGTTSTTTPSPASSRQSRTSYTS